MMRKLPETALAAINTVMSEYKKSSALRRVKKHVCGHNNNTVHAGELENRGQ